MGALSQAELINGTRTITPTGTTTYILTLQGPGGPITRSVTITVSQVVDPPIVDPPESPIAVLNANTLEVSPGSPVVLTWATEHANSASIDNEVGDVSPVAGGSVTVNPTQTTTYELTAIGDGGTDTDSVTITVSDPDLTVDPPVILRFEGDPSSITTGQSSFLEWEVENATSLSINQGIGSVEPVDIGAERVNPSSTRTYTLTAVGPGGTRTTETTITVSDPPPACPDPPSIDSFGAADTSIFLGEAVDLDWSTSNTNDVSINQGIGSVGNDSDVSHTPSSIGTIVYRITASKPDCSDATRTVSVVVSARPPSPTITSFSVTPTSVQDQDSVTFAWATENGVSATIGGAGGAAPLNGSRTIVIGGSPGVQNFTLFVTGAVGALPLVAQRTVSVTIEEMPPADPIINYFRHVGAHTIGAGSSVTLEWDTENATTVTILNISDPDAVPITVASSGSRTLSPSATAIWRLRATAPGTPTANAHTTTTVNQQPVIDSFTATVISTSPLGTTVRLEWATSNTTSVAISGLTGTVLSGSSNIVIQESTFWTLTASGASGTTAVMATANVDV